ncbi:hypothetical protein [Sporosarcina sp. P35]|uniref:hypothetical protein n=1 Tax=Sporosarcina sp. P35 TaxID=2048246 RepID=UPI0013047817|nr:hypothetical protein [Sporosarcina sp. P35]
MREKKGNSFELTAALADGYAMSQTGRSPVSLITSPTACKAPSFSKEGSGG